MGIKRAFFHTSLVIKRQWSAHLENGAFNPRSGRGWQSGIAIYSAARQERPAHLTS
jgi:hypothetical protein